MQGQQIAYGKIPMNILKRFFVEGLTYRTAALAFATLLSMVPFMVVLLWVMAKIPFFAGVGLHVQDMVFHTFVADSAQKIVVYLRQFLDQIQGMSVVTVAFLLIAAVLLLVNIQDAFNTIWHAKARHGLGITLLYWLLFMILAPLLLGSGMLATTFLAASKWLDLRFFSYVSTFWVIIWPYLMTFVLYTMMNWLLPSCKVKLRYAAAGGLLSMLLFKLTRWGFAVYVHYATTYKTLYGALAVLPIFLIWIYLCWLIILFGAALSYELQLLSSKA